MAQVRNGHPSTAPPTTENEDCRRPKVRLRILPDGKHEHNLVSIWTEVAVAGNLRNLIKAKWRKRQGQQAEESEHKRGKLFPLEKYGTGSESIGYGRSGNVRLSRKLSNNREAECYAIKEYRRGPRETTRAYRNRSTSSFCISSCLRHINIVKVLDLVQESSGNYSEVMAFCGGGNLATLILRREKLNALEADCFFKQLARGVQYLHSVGVAHRDLKPENLLLTARGVLKIADFGEAECFRLPWETEPRMSSGRCGTIPYIGPELFLNGRYDPRPLDVWALGMIYMAMRTGKLLWGAALKDYDHTYTRYLYDRNLYSGFHPIERLLNVGGES